MRWISYHGLTYLQFPMLAAVPIIDHGIFLRSVSKEQGNRSDFNLGLRCGTPDNLIWDNRRRVRSVFGQSTMVLGRQVHGVHIAHWNQQRSKETNLQSDHIYLDGDALITDLKDQLLFIQVADCQAVMMVDPGARVVANVHSGWRGSIGDIVGKTVKEMVDRFGCRADRIVCGIGPSLGPCCAEFIHYRLEIPETYWGYRGEENRFNFWRITKDQLISAGVQSRNICFSDVCTRCNPHLFFSYRGEGLTGRFTAVIGLRRES